MKHLSKEAAARIAAVPIDAEEILRGAAEGRELRRAFEERILEQMRSLSPDDWTSTCL